MSDLDTLLDAKLDDLEDLPSFQPFPAGTHRCLATFDTKDINGKAAVELGFEMVECLETADNLEESAMPKQGDKSNTMFMLDNEFGRGNLKKCALPFAEALNLSSVREVIETVKAVECVVVTSLRTDKNDTSKQYLQVKEIGIV